MSKKKWRTPQLIVLVRGKPEEGVLSLCKSNSGGPADPAGQWSVCGTHNPQGQEYGCDFPAPGKHCYGCSPCHTTGAFTS